MKLIFCLLLLGLPAFAGDTNFQFAVRTNWVTAAPNFREVAGRLYNVQLSQKFEIINSRVISVSTNGILCNWTKTRDIHARSHSDSLVSSGNFLGSSGRMVYMPGPVIGHETIFSKDIVVENYPALAAEGQSLDFYAMRTGVKNVGGRTLELYNVGTPHVVAVVTTNRISLAARAETFAP